MKKFQLFLASWGHLGVFAFSLIESAGIPNPGGTDLMLLAVTIARPDQALLCALLATAGSIIGTAIFYEITRKGGEKYLAKYTSSGRGQRFRAWFMRYGLATVFIPALLPIPIIPFKVFAACAGAMSVHRLRFLVVLGTARILRYGGLAYLGAKLGENSFSWITGHKWQMLEFALVLFAVLYVIIRFSDRKRVE